METSFEQVNELVRCIEEDFSDNTLFGPCQEKFLILQKIVLDYRFGDYSSLKDLYQKMFRLYNEIHNFLNYKENLAYLN